LSVGDGARKEDDRALKDPGKRVGQDDERDDGVSLHHIRSTGHHFHISYLVRYIFLKLRRCRKVLLLGSSTKNVLRGSPHPRGLHNQGALSHES
jgi:hypothetical protein